MSQPNFLQVANSVQQCLDFCAAHPEVTASARYQDALLRVGGQFSRATVATDATYTKWRQLLGQELTAFREARLDYDRVVARCDEHGMDDVPRRRIVYHERDALLGLLTETAQWLRKHEAAWGWVAGDARTLEQHITDARARKAQADDAFLAYTSHVRARVEAYANATALVREFLRDAGTDPRLAPTLAPMDFDRV